MSEQHSQAVPPDRQSLERSGPAPDEGKAESEQSRVPTGPGDVGGGHPYARLWWIIFFRGCVALLLGASVLASDARRPALANFIGLYWLLGAGLTLRWALSNRWVAGAPLGLVAGIVGALAAAITLARSALAAWIDPTVFVNVLGGVVLCVGLLRLAGAMRDDQVSHVRPRLRHRLLIGALDSGLGILLLVTSNESRALVIGTAAWALVGGIVLLIDAVSLRRLASTARRRTAGGPADPSA
jgi:uncharacterized membrane protein HdeD (DUF308 family)